MACAGVLLVERCELGNLDEISSATRWPNCFHSSEAWKQDDSQDLFMCPTKKDPLICCRTMVPVMGFLANNFDTSHVPLRPNKDIPYSSTSWRLGVLLCHGAP